MSTLAEITAKFGYDPLACATNGRLRWDDPGLDKFESGWELFPLGVRVEVVIRLGVDNEPIWRKGTVVEQVYTNDRAIVVECDEVWHGYLGNYQGRGATIPVYMTEQRWLLSRLRLIDEPRREVAKK